MAHLRLRIHTNPAGADVFVNLKQRDGEYLRWVGFIDTGATVSVIPERFLVDLDHSVGERRVIIEQAGIARHLFEADEAFVRLTLEDEYGVQTRELEVRVWVAPTADILIGFDGILDRAVLHLDWPNRAGYLELD